jgi:RNA polymerase sigma-70 factor (ECF subfamily)
MTAKGATTAEIEAIYRDRARVFLFGVTALLRDGDAALDAVQDGFALALRRRETFRREGSLEAWLWRIVLNSARDRLRATQRELPASLYEREDETSTPTDELRHALRALPERQRLAVFLRYFADLSYGQIAEALRVKPGTVAASLNAAHAALRRELEEVAG